MMACGTFISRKAVANLPNRLFKVARRGCQTTTAISVHSSTVRRVRVQTVHGREVMRDLRAGARRKLRRTVPSGTVRALHTYGRTGQEMPKSGDISNVSGPSRRFWRGHWRLS